jgi:hypothetical protein
MINAVIALIKTAAAAKSLIFLIFSFFSGETKSAIFSIDEFNISVTKTNPQAKIKANHSLNEIFKMKPKIITTIVEKR